MPNPSSFEEWRKSFKDFSRSSLGVYEGIYKHPHRHPELPAQESRTATFVADHLENLGYKVQRNIGGCGVVGILSNGKGKTILLRSELDASPMEEKTGLHYASKVKQIDSDGQIQPVMHCSGHDMHMTCLLGAADFLQKTRSAWSGTLICLFQPNQGRLLGAQAMIDDGLFDKIPLPDMILAQHAAPMRAGTIGTRDGRVRGYLDSLSVRVYGQATGSSTPESGIDPILMATNIISGLQKLKDDLLDECAITCGYFHGGTDAGIIPEFADFTLHIRSFDKEIQETAVSHVKFAIEEECRVAGSPRSPRIVTSASCPPVDNDKKATAAFTSALRKYYRNEAAETMFKMNLDWSADDFVLLGHPLGKKPIPYLYWNFGVTQRDDYDIAEDNDTLTDLPSIHSARFAPEIQPSLKAGIKGLAIASVTFLQKEEI